MYHGARVETPCIGEEFSRLADRRISKPESAFVCTDEDSGVIDLTVVGAFASDPTPAGVPVRFRLYVLGIGSSRPAGQNVCGPVNTRACESTVGAGSGMVWNSWPCGSLSDLPDGYRLV
jgi:hypothetical protein